MRDGFYRRFATLLTAFSMPFLFVPHRVAAQEYVPPEPQVSSDLTTSMRGPLQQRLATAFPASFATGIQIFWEEHDGWVSPEVFDWWVRVVEDDSRQELTRDSAREMLRNLRPTPSPAFSTSSTRRICAVVGPSRNLIGANYGELIDAHNVVIRMNRAPTAGFESDVGVKSTHHVMWPKLGLLESEFDRSSLLLMTTVTAGTEDVFYRMRHLIEDDLFWPPELVNIVHPEFVKYLDDNWTQGQGAYPSTGFIALMLAVHVCDEVDVFGFGADASGRWDHYYEEGLGEVVHEEGLGEVVWFHPGTVETRVRRELEQQGILKVFHGSRLEVGLTLEDGMVTHDPEGRQPH